MNLSPMPFDVPARLPSDLAQVKNYWDKLRRGENAMPFWDDVKLSSLPELDGRLLLVDVFMDPVRYRFNTVGIEITRYYGADLAGKFADEVKPSQPFEFFAAQAMATVEACVPTFYRHGSSTYSRLLLPLWGNGQVGMPGMCCLHF